MAAVLLSLRGSRMDPVAEKSNSASIAIEFGAKKAVRILRQNDLQQRNHQVCCKGNTVRD
jgi:hypothetical protein